jgi:hypothetical protein
LQPPWFGANGIHLDEASFVAISDWLKLPMLQDFQSSNFPCRGRERSQVSEHNRRRRCAGRICLGWVESEASDSRAADAVLWREVKEKDNEWKHPSILDALLSSFALANRISLWLSPGFWVQHWVQLKQGKWPQLIGSDTR